MSKGAKQPAGANQAWGGVLELLCRLQTVLPDAVPVGGPAPARPHAGQRHSFDHDHVLPDLRDRFDTVREQLKSVAGWETARVRRPVLVLGSLDGVETGVRQLRRTQPLETTVMRVGEHDATLPTLPEVLRIKAFLCLDQNATRDYLDLAALAAHMGIEAAGQALWRMDELYQQKNGDTWAVRTQLIMQLAAPPPYDLDRVNLAEYKGVKPPFDQWSHVVSVCGDLSDWLLNACMQALAADASAASEQAKARIDAWRDQKAAGNTPPLGKLLGLKP